MSYSAAGLSSTYHVIANNIDWSKPVGAVFYFDGDYWFDYQSKVSPDPKDPVQEMAAVANQRNMVFIAVVSPDKDNSGDGITWWQNLNGNGDYFRSLAKTLINNAGLDRSNIWTMGYSGGAEFIAQETALDRQHEWRSGGGDLMIAGGGPMAFQNVVPASKNIPMYWYVGDLDGAGETWPDNWSAYGAATNGKNFYANNGFSKTYLKIQKGLDHHHYNYADYLRQVLDENPPSYRLVGAIGAYYWRNGAQGVFGSPSGNEFATRGGGAVQNFSNNRSIYWSEATGAHAMYWRSAIASRFAQKGFENGWGYPTTDEVAFNHGAKQHFRNGQYRLAVYWSAETGVQAMNENGAIFNKWASEGDVAKYGFPSTDELRFNIGAKQHFRKGNASTVIYWSQATGAHAMNDRGAIFNKWVAEGDVAKYGFPITDETEKDGVVSVRFSKGQTISWSAQRGLWVS